MLYAPVIECQADVPAGIEAVWAAWTTREGLEGFLAPRVNIDARPGGQFEALFVPEAPAGSRGTEGMRFLALQKPVFLSFTWNAPPKWPEVRQQMTVVEVRMEETGRSGTTVSLRHGGWGSGGEWEDAFQYFAQAWPEVVLFRLAWMFAEGPVDWNQPPRKGKATRS